MGYTLVTGGSRGLGFECAKALSALGQTVVLIAKDETRLAQAAASLGCEYQAVDLEDLEAT
jgi:NADP-dependent 3-hydroxy acid dehydrogenase YdfG